jgi:hypothetical protein
MEAARMGSNHCSDRFSAAVPCIGRRALFDPPAQGMSDGELTGLAKVSQPEAQKIAVAKQGHSHISLWKS